MHLRRYGTVGWLDGQVLGGRWKPLHHMMEQHLYRDVVAICGADALCFVKNSNPLESVFGKFQAVLFDIHSQTETEISSTYVAVGSGPAIHRFCLGDPFAQHDCPSYSSIVAAHQCAAASCVVILRLTVVPPLPSEQFGKPQSPLLHDTLRVEHLYMMISHNNA
jgi:hypothetical protein